MTHLQFGFLVGLLIVVVWAGFGFLIALAAVVAGLVGVAIARLVEGRVDMEDVVDRVSAGWAARR